MQESVIHFALAQASMRLIKVLHQSASSTIHIGMHQSARHCETRRVSQRLLENRYHRIARISYPYAPLSSARLLQFSGWLIGRLGKTHWEAGIDPTSYVRTYHCNVYIYIYVYMAVPFCICKGIVCWERRCGRVSYQGLLKI